MIRYECPKCRMLYDKPGLCTMCKVKLVEAGSNGGHDDHAHHSMDESRHKKHDHTQHHQHMIIDFRKRFVISVIATIPVLFLSPLIQGILGFSFTFRGDMVVLWLLSSFIFFYGGWPFLAGIYDELKKWEPGMMTLIALAISVAYAYSTAVVFGLAGEVFFWELATLVDIMLLGHWLEMRSVMGASRALEELARLMPDTAHLLKGDDVVDVKITDLKKGDIVMVRAGEKIPADGVIIKGQSYIDESMLTGESKPVSRKKDAKVIGGSVNGDGVIVVRVTGTGEESYLNKVISLVRDAQGAKSKTQRLADKAARWLAVIAITAGTGTFIYWAIYGPDIAFAIERMATVMIIACPHALGLAIPLVTAVSTTLSAKNGLLIRNRTAFENARKITTVVFDKTGTLTEGNFGVSSVKPLDKRYPEDRILRIAAALEQNSEHPIAKAIIARAKGLNKLKALDIKVLKGEGIEGRVEGAKIALLSKKAAEKRKIASDEKDSASTKVFVVSDGRLVGIISLSDKIRKESYEAISLLKEQGIKSWMLTGDNSRIAEKVAAELGMEGFYAEVLPHEKQERIKELQAKGEFVAMAGDGINDAPALAQADIGIAIGSGTDVAAETADIILVNSNPKDIVSLIIFGKATHRKMVQNLAWATGYNAFAIPLAAGVLYSFGFLISPALGAALMSVSTVIVAVNAKLLKVK